MPLELQRRLQSWVICISRYIVARPCVRRTVSVICHDDNHKVAPRGAIGFFLFLNGVFPGCFGELKWYRGIMSRNSASAHHFRVYIFSLSFASLFCESRGNLLSGWLQMTQFVCRMEYVITMIANYLPSSAMPVFSPCRCTILVCRMCLLRDFHFCHFTYIWVLASMLAKSLFISEYLKLFFLICQSSK
jgi:hypothetical protein